MDKLSVIHAPILKELEEQTFLLKDSLKSQIPLINSVVNYFLEQKGKMIRPVMVLLAAKLTGNGVVTRKSMNAAIALELLHNATLIHDDVVDEAMKRRSHASINALWDNKIAVLMGDFFLARCLAKSTETGSLEIQAVLSELSNALAEGEMAQLANARNRIINEEAYFSVIKDKTASLFIACMKLGALSVDAPDHFVKALEGFGEKLGILFQIRDDIFDYYSDPEVGKPTGNDIREGKVTLPLLFALRSGSGEEHDRMMALLKIEELNVEQVAQLVNYAKENGGIDYAVAAMRHLAFEAKEILSVFPDNEVRTAMFALIEFVMERKK